MSPPGRSALFPLGTVLFPDGPLSLRVFEARYLDMVSACLREDQPFGVVLIDSGREVGRAATPHPVGTFANIVDWNRYDDGVLGILAVGTSRFRIISTEVQSDQLLTGELEPLPEPDVPTPADARDLVDLVHGLLARVDKVYANLPRRPDDAAWLGYRMAELFPLPMTEKQRLLELHDPLQRLAELRVHLRAFETQDPGEG